MPCDGCSWCVVQLACVCLEVGGDECLVDCCVSGYG